MGTIKLMFILVYAVLAYLAFEVWKKKAAEAHKQLEAKYEGKT